MKAVGNKKHNDGEGIILEEVGLVCSIAELDQLIQFLEETKANHEQITDDRELAHSHYRDWNKDWSEEEADIVIYTPYPGRENK